MKRLSLLFTFVCIAFTAFSADYYWSVTSGNWNNTANWRTGGYGSSGSTTTTLPSSSDNIFIGNGSNNATVTLNINDTINNITIQGTGQIFINGSSFSLHVWGNLTSSNTANTGGGTANIKLTGTGSQYLTGNASNTGLGKLPNLTINKSSGTLYLSDNITTGGSSTLTHTAGTIDAGTSRWMLYFNNTLTGHLKFYDLEFYGSANTITFNDSVTVLHNLYTTGTSTITLRKDTVNLYGDLIGECTGNTLFSSSSAMTNVCLRGSANQTIRNHNSIPASTAWLPSLMFAKSGGTVYLRGGTLSTCLHWTNDYSSTAINSDSATVYFSVRTTSGNWHTIGGTVTTSLKRVVFYSLVAGSHYFGTGATPALSITDSFTVAGSTLVRFNTGTVDLLGDVHINTTNSDGYYAFQAPSFRIKGTANQTFYGAATSGIVGLTNLTVDKSGGTVTFKDYIACGHFTYTAGTVDFTTHQSTLEPHGTVTTKNGSGTQITLHHLYIGDGASPLGSDAVVHGNITIAADGTFVPYNASNGSIYYTVELKGNLANNGTHTSIRTYYKVTGTGNQTFGGSSASVYSFTGLIINKPSGTLTFQKPVTLTTSFTLTDGILYTDATNLLTLNDNITVTTPSDSSHVVGPVKKIGNDAFTFPVGNGTYYHPINITAPTNATDAFTGEYVNTAYNPTQLDTSLTYANACGHWNLDRINGTNNVKVKLYWNTNTCDVYTLSTLKVARYDATDNKWKSIGSITTSGTVENGYIETSSTQNAYGKYVLGKKSPMLFAHAGNDTSIQLGRSTVVGTSSTGSGGLTPYTYEWTPNTRMSDASSANPRITLLSTTSYILKITDLDGSISKDTVIVSVDTNVFKCGVFTRDTPFDSTETAYTYTLADRFGNRYTVEEQINPNWQIDRAGACGNSGFFELEYLTGSNFTNEEKETICAVFEYLSDHIQPLQSSATVPIRFIKEIFDPADESLAKASPLYMVDFTNPCGYSEPLTWNMINTMQDYSTILPPGFPSAVIIVREIPLPGSTNWHTLSEDPGIASDEYDLYTAVLHEALHTLGFASRVGLTGAPIDGYYSLWDLHLKDHVSGEWLLEDDPITGCCTNQAFNSFFNTAGNVMPYSVISSCDGGPAPVISFEDIACTDAEYSATLSDMVVANMLSHLEDNACLSGTSFVMNYNFPPETTNRLLSDQEWEILCKLGYTTTGTTTSCPAPILFSTVDDGVIDVGSNVSWSIQFSAPASSNQTNVLANDLIPAGATITQATLISGCGDYDDLTIGYFPLPNAFIVSGFQANHSYQLCYEVTLSTGECDHGLIYLYMPYPEFPPCPVNNSCGANLFCYGDFDLVNFGSLAGTLPSGTGGFEFAFDVEGCENIFYNGTGGSTADFNFETPANTNIVAQTKADNSNYTEYLTIPLSSGINPDCSVTISFDAFCNNPTVGVQIVGTTLKPCDVLSGTIFPDCPNNNSGFVCLDDGSASALQITNGGVLSPYSFIWTNTTSQQINYLILRPVVAAIPSSSWSWVYFDNIEIIQDCPAEITITPTVSPACLGGNVTIDYEICYNGLVSPVDADLTVVPPAAAGLTPSTTGGDFVANEATVNGLVAGGACQTVSYVMDVGNTAAVGPTADPIQINVSVPGACIVGETDVVPDIQPCAATDCLCSSGIAIGTNLSSINYISDLVADATLPPSSYNGCVSIIGTLIVDQSYQFNSGSELLMGPQAKIIVNPTRTLAFDGSQIHGCNYMWNTIEIRPSARLDMRNTIVLNADSAITARGASHLILNSCTFAENYKSIVLKSTNPLVAASLSTFNLTNNVFSGTAGTGSLLAPYPSTQRSMSGIDAYRFFIFSTSTLTTNHFERMNFGIRLYDSWLTVRNWTFDNIRAFNNVPMHPSGTAIYGRNSGGSMESLDQQGVGQTATATFNNCRYGIWLSGMRIMASKNKMTDMVMGIWLQNATNANVRIQDNAMEVRRQGIRLFQYNGMPQCTIANNIIDASQATGLSPVGTFAIEMVGSDLPNVAQAQIFNNEINLFNYYFGMLLLNVDNVQLYGNEVHCFNENIVDPNGANLFGIQVNSSNNTSVTCNKVYNEDDLFFTGLGQIASPAGIVLFESPGVNVRCNQTYGMQQGIVFQGNCGNAVVEGNEFNDDHIALRYAPSSFTGAQGTSTLTNGNRWIGTGYNHTGLHLGGLHGGPSSVFVDQSHYLTWNNGFGWDQSSPRSLRVLGVNYETITPAGTWQQYTNQNWFGDVNADEYTCWGMDPLCDRPTPPTELAGAPDDGISLARAVAYGTLNEGECGEQVQWNANRWLVDCIERDTFLLSDSVLAAYYDTIVNHNLYDYQEVAIACKAAMAMSATDSLMLDSLSSDVDDLMLAMATQDSTINDTASTSGQRETAWAAKAILAADLHTADSLYAAYLQSMQGRCDAANAGVKILNNALTDTAVYEYNARTVTDIYLETVAAGVDTFTDAQLSDLIAIAEQCPLAGGKAVFWARSLYKMVNDSAFYDDEVLCYEPDTTLRKSEQEISLTGFKIIPNPAAEQAQLYWSGYSGNGTVELCDALGRVFHSQTVRLDAGTLRLDLTPYASGLYTLRLAQDGRMLERGKLVVSKN